MKTAVHVIAGVVALACVAAFLAATLAAELLLGAGAIPVVKEAIVTGLFVLIPSVIVAGGSGFSLARRRGGALVERKRRRMPFIALNGLLVLLPAALYLDHKAGLGELDAVFYAVQVVEILFGAAQLALLSLNLRDGLRLAGRLRPPAGA